MKNICIVGGGACGVAAFIELFIQITSHGLKEKISIIIIEKAKKVGYGLAFGTEEKGHLLNTQSELMGIYAQEVNHFTEWLSKNGRNNRGKVEEKGDIESAYTSRIMYGDYLYEQFTHYLEKSREVGVQVELVCSTAVDLDYQDERFSVKLENGKPIKSDYVILALGNPEATNYKDYDKYPHFLNSPWPSSKVLRTVGPEDHVGVLGSSLSAIDTIITLIDHGHKGKISLFSIEGVLPRVQPENNNEVEREFLTLENVHQIKRKYFRAPKVKEIFRLFMKDVDKVSKSKIDWSQMDRTGGDPVKFLKYDIAAAKEGGDALLNVCYSLRYDASTLWSWLSREEKNFFKKWLGSQWTINRHGMPLANAERLVPLLDAGKLVIHADIKDIKPEGDHFIVSYGKDDFKIVDKLINSTGSPSHLEAMDCTLTSNMLKKELLSPYESGGAVINELTMEVLNPRKVRNIYATGQMVNGMLLDINAVWFNVRTIATISKDIICRARYGENH